MPCHAHHHTPWGPGRSPASPGASQVASLLLLQPWQQGQLLLLLLLPLLLVVWLWLGAQSLWGEISSKPTLQ